MTRNLCVAPLEAHILVSSLVVQLRLVKINVTQPPLRSGLVRSSFICMHGILEHAAWGICEPLHIEVESGDDTPKNLESATPAQSKEVNRRVAML
eukprot:2650557-Amphidinium_carterae.1